MAAVMGGWDLAECGRPERGVDPVVRVGARRYRMPGRKAPYRPAIDAMETQPRWGPAAQSGVSKARVATTSGSMPSPSRQATAAPGGKLSGQRQVIAVPSANSEQPAGEKPTRAA